MKTSIIIIAFLTIVFVLAAVMISAAQNAPDNSINYSPTETTEYPRFEIVTEKKSIYELMNQNEKASTEDNAYQNEPSVSENNNDEPDTTNIVVIMEETEETEKKPASFNQKNKKIQ